MEMSYLRGACGVTRWEGESNESVYERCVKWNEVWYSRMIENNYFEVVLSYKENEEFVKKVYVSEIRGPRKRRRPIVRWKDRMEEYMHDRVANRGGGIEQARRLGRGVGCYAVPITLGNISRGNKT